MRSARSVRRRAARLLPTAALSASSEPTSTCHVAQTTRVKSNQVKSREGKLASVPMALLAAAVYEEALGARQPRVE
jgi:hypothetical protein